MWVRVVKGSERKCESYSVDPASLGLACETIAKIRRIFKSEILGCTIRPTGDESEPILIEWNGQGAGVHVAALVMPVRLAPTYR